MTDTSLRKHIGNMLDRADIVLDGERPWDIQVKNNLLFPRVLAKGSLGFGEAYMDGWWDSESLDQLADRFLNANLDIQF